jgi:hypothetical protein
VLLFGIAAIAALVVADATSRFVNRRRGSRRQAALVAVAGSLVALSVIVWAVVVLPRTDPAAALGGFEPSRSRMIPSFGAGLALLGGLLTTVSGVVGRVARPAR